MSQRNLKKIERIKYKNIREIVLPKVEELITQEVNKEINRLVIINKLQGYLGLYWPLKNEVDLRRLKNNLRLRIALPASNRGGLITYRPWRGSSLRNDDYGIPAPLNEPILKASELSLLIVPALAVDLNGYRIGYGGGFFDRLRSQKNWRAIPSIVVLPKACVSHEPFPKDSWDIPFDGWINEDGYFRSILRAYL